MDLDHLLNLIRQLTLDVPLQTPQQERPENLVQTLDDDERLFFVQLDLVSGAGVGERRVEPLVELTELKILERTKLGRAQSSGRSFWSGVPVRMRRQREW